MKKYQSLLNLDNTESWKGGFNNRAFLTVSVSDNN